eukprot:1185096-Prorocentrum_minimum.AAC.4
MTDGPEVDAAATNGGGQGGHQGALATLDAAKGRILAAKRAGPYGVGARRSQPAPQVATMDAV